MQEKINLKYPVKGMTQDDAEKILGLPSKKVKISEKEVNLVELPNKSISAYCRDGIVYSVCIKNPYQGNINGILIGDSKIKVLEILGRPDRLWPIADGRDRWFYNKYRMRVDFERGNKNIVEMVYL
jgi:hypothetical protein